MSRTDQLRAAKRRQRDAEKASGCVVLTVRLSARDAAIFAESRKRQRGPVEGFAGRALVVGAMFLANAGNPRGSKISAVSAEFIEGGAR